MATRDSIRAKVRVKLQDKAGNRWSDDELNDWIDEGQREYVEETGCLRAQAPISVKENEDVYTWPEDCLRVLRIENTAGKEVKPTTSSDLERRYGGTWRETEGTPSEYYSDLDGAGSFRFYPKADPSFEASGVSFNPSISSPAAVAVDIWETVYATSIIDNRVYVLGLENIHVLNAEDFSLISSTAHGQTIGTTDFNFIRKDPASEVVVWCDNKTIYKTLIGGSTSQLISAGTGSVLYLSPIATDGRYLFTQDRGAGVQSWWGDIAAGIGAIITIGGGATLTKIFQAIVPHISSPIQNTSYNTFYIAAGTDGLLSCVTADITNLTLISATAAYGITEFGRNIDANGTVTPKYAVNLNGALVDEDLASIGDVTLGTQARLYADISKTLWYGYEPSGGINASQIIKADSDYASADESWYYSIASSTGALERGFAYNGLYYAVGEYTRRLEVTNKNIGLTVYLDGNAPVSEYGLLVDYNETDDVVTFAQDYGVVTSAYDATTLAYVFYIRTPQDNVIEIDDDEALENYTVSRALEIESDSESAQKSFLWMAKFNDCVKKEKRKQARQYVKSNHSTTLYTF